MTRKTVLIAGASIAGPTAAGSPSPTSLFARKSRSNIVTRPSRINARYCVALFGGGGDGTLRNLQKQIDDDPHFYLDAQAQVVMPSWCKGRVALIGDAAHCASPFSDAGGLLGLIGAYRLAGELLAANGDHVAAFSNYDVAHRPVMPEKQRHLFTGMFVPRTWFVTKVRMAW